MNSKKCENYDKSKNIGYYNGNEPSPKGFGICARYLLEGEIALGKDGYLWKVKNGRWVKTDSFDASYYFNNKKKSPPKK